jgi:hypothetical protein
VTQPPWEISVDPMETSYEVDLVETGQAQVTLTSGSVPGPQGVQGPVGPTGTGVIVINADQSAPPAGTPPNTVVFRKVP